MKMFRNALTLIMILVVSCSNLSTVFASSIKNSNPVFLREPYYDEGPRKITIDYWNNSGSSVTFEVEKVSGLLMIDGIINKEYFPLIENGRSLVPIAVISKELGAKVDWNEDNKKVVITKDEKIIELKIGNSKATVNGSQIDIGSTVKVYGDRIYVPLRFIAESLSIGVGYDKSYGAFPIVWIAEDYADESKIKTKDEAKKYIIDEVQKALISESAYKDQFINFEITDVSEKYGRFYAVRSKKLNTYGNEITYLVDKYTKQVFCAGYFGIVKSDDGFIINVHFAD